MYAQVTFKSLSLIEMILELKAVCREISYYRVKRVKLLEVGAKPYVRNAPPVEYISTKMLHAICRMQLA